MKLQFTPILSLLSVTILCLILLACTKSTPPPPEPPPPKTAASVPSVFEDVSSKSGINFAYRNGEEAGHFAIIESLGGGVAMLDYDRDGLLDLFFPGGGFYEGKIVRGYPCKLYRNCGNFRFEDVTERSQLNLATLPYSHGAAAFDYDCDGWLDLLITGYNRVTLLHNEPGLEGRKFVDVTQKANLTERLWSTSAAWGDLDGDGFPEIYIAHYGDWGFDTNHPLDCTYNGKTRDVCAPRQFRPLPHSLYRNNRNGTFTDVTQEQKLRTDGRGIGVLFVDVNNDSKPDIYTANDTDDNFLYVNSSTPQKLALTEGGLVAGVAKDDHGLANGSMGLDAGDYNRSGRASLIVTNYENELPALYRNRTDQSQPRFTFATGESGLAMIGGQYVSWGTGFLDYDLDGWEDLLIANGHAIRFPTKIDRRQKPVLCHNEMGRYRIVRTQDWPYFRDAQNARGAAFGDLNNDGKPDVVVSHVNEPVVILKNNTQNQNRWVGLKLQGANSRDIVGTRVVLESKSGRQTKFVKGGASYASTNDCRLLFGLATDSEVESLTIHWSHGPAQVIPCAKVNCYWQVAEGQQPVLVDGPHE